MGIKLALVGNWVVCTYGLILPSPIPSNSPRLSYGSLVGGRGLRYRDHGLGGGRAITRAVVMSVEVAQQIDTRREATKAALLGVFGEKTHASSGVKEPPLDPQVSSSEVSLNEESKAASASVEEEVLACPSTLGDLGDGFRWYGGGVRYKLSPGGEGTKYLFNGVYTDFVQDTRQPWSSSRAEIVQEGTFQNPLTAFLYERGWRRSFNANGFPGIEKEFMEVQEFFEGAEGGVVMDLSCGSGLMTRRLAASKKYSRVIGGDLSAAMLSETRRRFVKNGLGKPELIRCDVSRLPVKSGSVDGIHAGAALHCWTRLEEALSEIHRVLKPGGVFFATTFLMAASLNTNRAAGFRFFTLEELQELARGAGFTEVEVHQNGRACAIVKARKGKEVKLTPVDEDVNGIVNESVAASTDVSAAATTSSGKGEQEGKEKWGPKNSKWKPRS